MAKKITKSTGNKAAVKAAPKKVAAKKAAVKKAAVKKVVAKAWEYQLKAVLLAETSTLLAPSLLKKCMFAPFKSEALVLMNPNLEIETYSFELYPVNKNAFPELSETPV